MTLPILVRTHHEYDSYRDFWRLVEASRLPTCRVREIDLSLDVTYVVTPLNGELLPHLATHKGKKRGKVVWWNLERPEDDTLKASLDQLDGKIDGIWVSDRTYAELDDRFTYVPVAGHPNFGTRSLDKIYDVCHLAYLWGRRQAAVRTLAGQGLKIAPEAWGRDRQDHIVAKSRVMLNLHQYEGMSIVAPIRFAVAASYAIPVVSESYRDVNAWTLCMKIGRIDELVEHGGITRVIRGSTPAALEEHGQRLHKRLCVETDFGREVVKAAAAL